MYRWTLADVVLVVVFLVALFGAGVMLKTMREVERLADENHPVYETTPANETIKLDGPAP
jgi:hypothetical protein